MVTLFHICPTIVTLRYQGYLTRMDFFLLDEMISHTHNRLLYSSIIVYGSGVYHREKNMIANILSISSHYYSSKDPASVVLREFI